MSASREKNKRKEQAQNPAAEQVSKAGMSKGLKTTLTVVIAVVVIAAVVFFYMLGNGFFDDFFSPVPSLMGRSGWMLEDPFDDFFADMPALSAAPAQQREEPCQQKQNDLVGKEEQSRFAYMRQMNALKLEMKKAVHQENFERAAELRDQIRQLEAEHKESK